MHNNYYFFRQLTKRLEQRLRHTVISQCFSQNKEELIIQSETASAPFFIRAGLSPQFSCLSFPETYHRARKNSVDLFQSLIGQRILTFRQFENERSFAMHCSNDVSLLFKMHGNRSNVILFEKERPSEVFKNSLGEDINLDLQSMDRVIDWSYEYFVSGEKSPESIYFTLGKLTWQFLKSKNFDNLPPKEQWEAIQQVRSQLENPQAYYIQEAMGRIVFSLLDGFPTKRKYEEPVSAVTEFNSFFLQTTAFTREKSSAISALRSKIATIKNYVRKTEEKLEQLETENNYRVWADLLMANLHAIPAGCSSVTLPDLYHNNHPTEIKLKPELTSQKNAAIFYRKAKNQQIEIDHVKKLIVDKRNELETLEQQIGRFEEANDKSALQKLSGSKAIVNEKKKQVAPLPYREVEYNGYKIWIGRNAESNDTLTLKFGYKEDLWLHAKDVAGSHVLLKHQAGKKFPKDVIEYAASLAAYYSKRKNESLCPVVVTPKKFVRKRKGDPAGVVVVEREEVLMVVPGARS